MASPSPLRLKPRLRPAAEGAGSGANVAMGAQPAVASPTVEPAAATNTSPPAIHFQPRSPVTPAAIGVVTPSVIESEVATPAVIGEPPKFKFKPKLVESAGAPASAAPEAGAQLIGALPPPAPTPSLPIETPAVAGTAPAAAGGSRGTLPQFPVIADAGRSRTSPSIPVPHIKLKGDALPEPETPQQVASNRKAGRRLVWLLAVALVGAGGYFGWPYLKPHVDRFLPSKSSAQILNTSSETLDKLAHAPAAAIDKAQEAIAARRASGQTRVDAAAVGEDVPDKPKTVAAPVATKPKPAAPPRPATMAPVGPGLAASVQLEAASDASPEFRTFVANARISGVFQGSPPRAMINGKLTRAGETVDPGLGVVFDGLDADKKHLIFRDHSGAIISRRY